MSRIGIAGAGIGGLILAVALEDQGTDVIVFERDGEVRDSGAGISLWPNALAALDAVGLGTVVRNLGRELASGGLRRIDGDSGATFSRAGFESAFGEGLVCIHRGELVSSLAKRLRAGTIRTNSQVVGYEVWAGGIRVRLADGSQVEADGLVGADGIHSGVASQLAGRLRYHYSGYTAWRGVAELEADADADSFWICLTSGHEFGWLPLLGGRTYWFATAWLSEGQVLAQGDQTYLKEVFGNCPDPIPQLLAGTPPDGWVRNDIVDRSVPRRWGEGAVTLLGDAAHPMRPHLGQGGCLAIEDAAVLSQCLGDGTHIPEAFRLYERRRSRRARRVVRLSRHAGFTYREGWRSVVFDRVSARVPPLPVRPFLRAVAPVAGYRAGARAVAVGKPTRRPIVTSLIPGTTPARLKDHP